MSEKRYYWLKLKEDFFQQIEIKRLKKYEKGDTYIVILMKLQLYSLKKKGCIDYIGIEDTFADELALAIDESYEDVSFVVEFLEKTGMLVEKEKNQYELVSASECMGSESSSAERMRKSRQKKNENNRKNHKNEQSDAESEHCYTDIEKDIEKEKDTDTDKDTDRKNTAGEKTIAYGKYKNVFLTCDEYKSLSGQSVANKNKNILSLDNYIEKLSSWLKTNNKKCYRCYDIIDKWIKEDSSESAEKTSQPSFNLDEFEKYALNFNLYDDNL